MKTSDFLLSFRLWNATRKVLCSGFAILGFVTAASQAQATGTLWLAMADGSLVTADLDTYERNTIGNSGLAFEDIAFMPDGALYGTRYNDSGFTGLYRIDVTTAAATLVQEFNQPDFGQTALVGGADGDLYSAIGGRLTRLDLDTMTPTLLVNGLPNGLNASGDLAFTPDGLLHLTAHQPGGDSYLVTFDPSSNFDVVSALPLNGMFGSPSALYGLIVDQDGGMIAIDQFRGLHQVDKTTGEPSVLTQLAPPGIVYGAAYQPVPEPSAVWLTAAAGAFAFVRRRR